MSGLSRAVWLNHMLHGTLTMQTDRASLEFPFMIYDTPLEMVKRSIMSRLDRLRSMFSWSITKEEPCYHPDWVC